MNAIPVKSGLRLAGGLLVLLAALAGTAAGTGPVDHGLFAGLLEKYVQEGRVDYDGFQREEARLDRYLSVLKDVDPAALDRSERFAFYTNLYNAWTIKLILSAYPDLESIKDLGSLLRSPWKKEIVRLGDATFSLDHIEHDILRPQFRDARVHFVINCAARSCPPLQSAPFTGAGLEGQLENAARDFINDVGSNRLEGDTLHLSRIFKWFAEDFGDDLVGYVAGYAAGDLKDELQARRQRIRVKYLPYNWSLNRR